MLVISIMSGLIRDDYAIVGYCIFTDKGFSIEDIKKAGTFCTRYNRIINIFSTTMKSALVRIFVESNVNSINNCFNKIRIHRSECF